MSLVHHVILETPLPSVRRADLRREPRKVWAQEVRALLKSLGIQGVKVTTPNYSMARSIDIKVPKLDHPGRDPMKAEDWTDYYDYCLSVD